MMLPWSLLAACTGDKNAPLDSGAGATAAEAPWPDWAFRHQV